MPLGLILGLGRAFRRKRTSSLDILSSKRAPRDYYKGKNCKPTGFHTRKESLGKFEINFQLEGGIIIPNPPIESSLEGLIRCKFG
ncbi:hypothetical protein L484_008343 [Morus notabilis]|uniref:Uncharacterized protein n=1 Tax=Morus notabilis TaxID=981085 RepID=W9RZX7_9ROSA|nr:hypothetical protein L484_008343 [Morus notabilis]